MPSVTGPTSVSITPNPFDTALTIHWSGLAFNGVSIDRGLRYCWRSSPDNKTWSSWSDYTLHYTTASSGSFSPPVPNAAMGSYVQYRLYGTGWTTGNTNYLGPEVYVTARKLAPTACGAPTACSLSAVVAEGAVTLSWSGAKSGTGNAVTSYEIQYCESADRVNWDAWKALSVVNSTAASGSLSVKPSATRGH